MSNFLLSENVFDFSGESFNAETSLESLLLQKAARVTREANLERSRALYRAALERLVVSEKSDKLFQLGQREEQLEAFLKEEGACVVAIQPLFPAKTVFDLPQMLQKAGGLRQVGSLNERFLSRYENTVPGGLLFLDERKSAYSRDSQQIHASGIVCDFCDCVSTHKERRILRVSSVAERFVITLRAARALFQDRGFEADLAVSVALDGVAECSVLHLLAQSVDQSFLYEHPLTLLPSYRWAKTLSVTTWKSEHDLQECAVDFIEEILWGLGQNQTTRTHVEKWLRQAKLFVE